MDGLESTRLIKKIWNQFMEKPENAEGIDVRKTPIVALTANDSPLEREACMKSGMSFFICKPPDQKEFKRVLRTVFGELIESD